MHELPLVFFTVLAQASAGLAVLAVINHFLLKPTNSNQAAEPSKTLFFAFMVSLILVGVAGFSAILHLGQPFRAINALFGAGRSAMSNEIISCAVYGGFVFLAVLIMHYKLGSKAIINALSGLVVISALALITLIPRVYNFDTVVHWHTGYTSLQMVLTSVVLGGALACVFYTHSVNKCLVTIGVMVSAAMMPGYFAFLGQTDLTLLGNDMFFWAAKMALLVLGTTMLWVKPQNQKVPMAVIASIVLIIAEIFGRIGFYDLWSISM